MRVCFLSLRIRNRHFFIAAVPVCFLSQRIRSRHFFIAAVNMEPHCLWFAGRANIIIGLLRGRNRSVMLLHVAYKSLPLSKALWRFTNPTDKWPSIPENKVM